MRSLKYSPNSTECIFTSRKPLAQDLVAITLALTNALAFGTCRGHIKGASLNEIIARWYFGKPS